MLLGTWFKKNLNAFGQSQGNGTSTAVEDGSRQRNRSAVRGLRSLLVARLARSYSSYKNI